MQTPDHMTTLCVGSFSLCRAIWPKHLTNDALTHHGRTSFIVPLILQIHHGTCSLTTQDADFVHQIVGRHDPPASRSKTISPEGGVKFGVLANRDTLWTETTSLRLPTPIPALCLHKQVNQTQRSAGCDTNPSPTTRLHSHQSRHLDFTGKPNKHIQNTHPWAQLACFSAELSSAALAAGQALKTRLKKINWQC